MSLVSPIPIPIEVAAGFLEGRSLHQGDVGWGLLLSPRCSVGGVGGRSRWEECGDIVGGGKGGSGHCEERSWGWGWGMGDV